MPHGHEGPPEWKAPPLACDAHFHVFGAAERYPYAGDLRYKPPAAPLADFLALARTLGIERFVFVQPSAYGRDNTCMLDAMREVRVAARRGIVDVDENIPDAELERLNALGVRGVRINVSPVKPPEAGFASRLIPRIERLDARCAEIGWQLDFLTPGWLTSELMGTLKKLKVNFTLAHLGMFLARDGVKQPGFQQLLDFLRHGTGRCWVKLTGAYRMSVAPGFADAAPMAQALIEAAPDRLIWGSDYPHLSFADKVGSVELFNLLGKWAADEATRRTILVENPQRLYGFS
ncbi:MAG: amidohydrolase family protein [Betaproteobacteria bacterium]|nr:amidohydrolase family protein [Betaproteobacteria bacterium]